MTILFGPKRAAKSQSVLGKSAKGVPHVDVLILEGAFWTSLGTDPSFRAQNQILNAASVRSIAYLQTIKLEKRPDPYFQKDVPTATAAIETRAKAIRLVCLHATSLVIIDGRVTIR